MSNLIKRSAWIAATLLGWTMLVSTAQAASFDCAEASTPQEKLICFDYRLSDLDSQLAWSYAEALKQAKDTSALKQSQKNWVAERGKCADVNCIIHAYVNRIEELIPGAKLEEVYFPKGNIPWEFFPKPGYEVSTSAKIKENKLIYVTYLKGTMTHGEDLIIPADDHDLSATSTEHEATSHLRELTLINSKLELVPIGEHKAFVELASMHLAEMLSGYGTCKGGLGLSGIYVGRDMPWTKNNVLVSLRPHEWTAYSGDCYEVQLKVDPTMMEIVVYNQSLYLSERHGEREFVLRLDHNLQTASTLLGKIIYMGWGNDLEGLTGKACDELVSFHTYSSEHRICIDEQLQKLIGEVGRFYNY